MKEHPLASGMILLRGQGGVSRLAPAYCKQPGDPFRRDCARGRRDRSRCPRTTNSLLFALAGPLALRVAVIVLFVGGWWSAGAMAVLGYLLILRGRR